MPTPREPMEKHVVSLELAKQLKETGWTKPTEFYYTDCDGKFRIVEKNFDLCMYIHDCLASDSPCNGQLIYEFVNEKEMEFDIFSAPLATEILEELPRRIQTKEGDYASLEIRLYPTGIDICYYHPHSSLYQDYKKDDTLSDALAKMWLYLRKEKLL